MSVEMYKADGVDFMIEYRAFRQRLFWDGELVSDMSTVRPRLSVVHRFITSEPPSNVEVRTFYPGGWLVERDGKFVAGQPPGVWLGVIWSLMALVGLATFFASRRPPGPLTLFAPVLALGHFAGRLSYEKRKRSVRGM